MAKGIINDLGPCEVVFGGESLGVTLGDVVFKYTPESRDVKEDQQGITPVEAIFVGAMGDVTVPLTRMQLAKMAAITPGATLSSSTLMQVYSPVGINRYDTAQALILKPIENGVGTSDQTKWITFPKASPNPDLNVVFNVETQRVYNVIFKFFPSQVTPIGELWRIGA